MIAEGIEKRMKILRDRKERADNMFDDYNACNNSFGYKGNALAIPESVSTNQRCFYRDSEQA